MPRDPSRNQVNNGLSYQKQVPKFLQNFGQPAPSRSPPPEHHPNFRGHDRSSDRPGREALPERPKEGQWADGSDEEDADGGRGKQRRRQQDSDDEWGDVYGGGGEEGPQVVVLKEGRHLTAEEVKKERRLAAGKSSRSPSPKVDKSPASTKPVENTDKAKPVIPKPNTSSAKRKLVGGDSADSKPATVLSKKKKKAAKGLLSFDEADGEN